MHQMLGCRWDGQVGFWSSRQIWEVNAKIGNESLELMKHGSFLTFAEVQLGQSKGLDC